MKFTKTQKAALLIAADHLRGMQIQSAAKARKSGGAVRTTWSDHAMGIGTAALEVECMAGLTFDQIAERKKNRRPDGRHALQTTKEK